MPDDAVSSEAREARDDVCDWCGETRSGHGEDDECLSPLPRPTFRATPAGPEEPREGRPPMTPKARNRATERLQRLTASLTPAGPEEQGEGLRESALLTAIEDGLAVNGAHIVSERSGYHMPVPGLVKDIAAAYRLAATPEARGMGESLDTIRLALKGARGLDRELARAIDLLDAIGTPATTPAADTGAEERLITTNLDQVSRSGGAEERLRAALVEAWNDGHRAGIGCGHDLAVCRHDDAAIASELDDLASWNEPVRAALHDSASSGTREETDD